MLKFLRKTSLYILALPFLLTVLGATSNQLVLNANHDTFPVRVNEVKIAKLTEGAPVVLKDGTVMLDDTHCVMSSNTHLNWMADIIDFRGDGIYSVGDLMLEVGEWSWTFAPYVWGVVLIGKIKE